MRASINEWKEITYYKVDDSSIREYIISDSLISSQKVEKRTSYYILELTQVKNKLPYVIDLGFADHAEIYTIEPSFNFMGKTGYFVSKKHWPKNMSGISLSPNQFILDTNTTKLLICIKQISPWSNFEPKIIAFESWKSKRIKFLFERNITQGLFYGALLIMFAFNLLVYLIYKDKAYLFYSLYIITLCFSLLPPFELAYNTPLANNAYLIKHLEILGDYGFITFYFYFIVYFLDIRNRFLKTYRVIRYYLILIITSFSVSQIYFLLTKYYAPTQYIYQLNSILAIPLLIFVFFTVVKQKDILSKFILTGSLLGMLGSGWVLYSILFGSTFPHLDHYIMEVGHLAELLMFSVGLGVRFRMIEKERTQLKEIGDFKSSFFTNVTHEFRTPLTLIISPLEDSLKKGKQLEKNTTKLILRNANKLLELINQLLDLSKLDAGKMKLNLSSIDIMQYLKSYVLTFKSLTDIKNIDLQYECEPQSLQLNVDIEKLNKIISNILFNAIKYTEKDGFVKVRVIDKSKYVSILIMDNGIGIPEDKLPLIFDRYYQSNIKQPKQIIEGTGIGLSLAKELIELHHGNISVSSNEKTGTTIEITFPKLKEAGKKISQDGLENPNINVYYDRLIKENDSQFTTTVTTNEKASIILVVEDNKDVRDFIISVFNNKYSILQAENGKQGVEIAGKYLPDIIISDLMMPEMNGVQMTEKIKSNFETSHIPVIMLTAKGDTSDRIIGLDSGADAYLVKPFNADELRAQVNNLLNQRAQLRQLFTGNPIKSSESTGMPIQIKKFIDLTNNIIENNLDDEGFDVEKLSELLKINRTSLFRKLKNITGHSPSYYIRTCRLKKAAKLLQTENLTISEISYKVGFSNVSYFNKSFKEYFKVKPSEYG